MFDLENIMVTNTKKNELVSIVIPTYNRASFFELALNSAIHQTYENVEIIVVDDSTNEVTEKFCKPFLNKIKYFHRKEKGGMGSGYNFGIDKMEGTWFKPLSDDDILLPNSIEKLIEYGRNTNAKILYSDYKIIDDKNNELGIKYERNYEDNKEFSIALWGHQVGNFVTSLIHKSCFESVGKFDNTLGPAIDYDWWLRSFFLHDVTFFHVPEVLLKFRIHIHQSSWRNYNKKNNLKMQRERTDLIRNKIKNSLLENNPMKWQKFIQTKKNYEQNSRKNGSKNLIKSLLPYEIRNLLRRFLYNKLKSQQEIQCEICKIENKKSFLYVRPENKTAKCPNCSIVYENEHLEYFRRKIKRKN